MINTNRIFPVTCDMNTQSHITFLLSLTRNNILTQSQKHKGCIRTNIKCKIQNTSENIFLQQMEPFISLHSSEYADDMTLNY